nr:hypothetical protein [uncultured archaeon]
MAQFHGANGRRTNSTGGGLRPVATRTTGWGSFPCYYGSKCRSPQTVRVSTSSGVPLIRGQGNVKTLYDSQGQPHIVCVYDDDRFLEEVSQGRI